MRGLRLLAFLAAAFAYAVIVVGFVVRITGSGMGCGDDWPLCNGRILPPLDDVATLIEYGHRVAVVGLSGLMVPLVGVAYTQRRYPSAPLRVAVVAAGLLVAQALIGALAVWLELPAWTVVLHLSVALALLATLMLLGFRSSDAATVTAPVPLGRRATFAAVIVGALTILAGGLTANLNAGWACQGFPLCNGQLWPAGDAAGLVHTHWTHRLLGYALFVQVLGLALTAQRRQAPRPARHAAWIAFACVVAQVFVAAIMVLQILPPAWRGLHAALGAAVWVALVYLAWTARGGKVSGKTVSGEW